MGRFPRGREADESAVLKESNKHLDNEEQVKILENISGINTLQEFCRTLYLSLIHIYKIREFCSVPETETVVGVIAVGVPGEEPGRPKRKDTEEIVKFL